MTLPIHCFHSAILASLIVLSGCVSEPSDNATDAPVSAPPAATSDPTPQDTEISELMNSRFQMSLSLCPLSSVSNAPGPREGLRITSYQQFADIDGVAVAVAPVEKACLSSGFGPRNSRVHKGIDLHNASAVDVYAAAAGTVREKTFRDDYGNMVVIDHGNGVFTRYAHLESFAPDIETGSQLVAGATLGVMGSSAGYPIPRHLHFEVLTGEWGTRSGSFALDPVDVFARLSDN